MYLENGSAIPILGIGLLDIKLDFEPNFNTHKDLHIPHFGTCLILLFQRNSLRVEFIFGKQTLFG